MGFFSKMFGSDKSKVYLDNGINTDLSNKRMEYIVKYENDFNATGVNIAYLDRMIDYIDMHYNDIDVNNIKKIIEEDCILLEIAFFLPPTPIQTTNKIIYLKNFYKAKNTITNAPNENKGLFWRLLNKHHKINPNFADNKNMLNIYTKFIKSTNDGDIILTIYKDLILEKLNKKDNDTIINIRFNEIFKSLSMIFANSYRITTYQKNYTKTGDIEVPAVSQGELININPGKFFVGYITGNVTTSDSFDYIKQPLEKIYIDFKGYENKTIQELYTKLNELLNLVFSNNNTLFTKNTN